MYSPRTCAGNALGTGLRPLGAALETTVTGPLGNLVGEATRGTLGPFLGNREERLEILGGEDKENRKQGQENSGESEVHVLLKATRHRGHLDVR